MVYVAMSESIRVDRVITDRRSMGWRTVMFGFLRSRRRDTRRHDEGEVLFLDWHHPWLFFLAVGTMLMSVMDAFMTLQLLDRGMVEANPVMAAALGQGTRFFAVSKMLMTGTSILALVFLAKARFLNRFRAGLMLTVFFSVYACLICYEFVFLLRSM
jgi:hypothetical protein